MTSSLQGDLIFQTERLAVHKITTQDADAIYSVYSPAKAMRWVDDGKPIEYADCVKWIEITLKNYKTRGYGLSAILLNNSNTLIGFCGLVHPNGQNDPEIKYAFLEAYWRNGYATEVVVAMIDHGKRSHNMRKIVATVAEGNLPSQRVLTKCGLALQETIREDDGSNTLLYSWKS